MDTPFQTFGEQYEQSDYILRDTSSSNKTFNTKDSVEKKNSSMMIEEVSHPYNEMYNLRNTVASLIKELASQKSIIEDLKKTVKANTKTIDDVLYRCDDTEERVKSIESDFIVLYDDISTAQDIVQQMNIKKEHDMNEYDD